MRQMAEVFPGVPQDSDCTLAAAHAVFKRWLGDDYDLDALDAMLAAAAVERLDGDPLWLLIISGSGNAKTETVQALAASTPQSSPPSHPKAHSCRPHRDRNDEGRHRRIAPGDWRPWCARDQRRHQHPVDEPGSTRPSPRRPPRSPRRVVGPQIGTDGGRSLSWSGRVAVIGAVTTAWDQAHAVIASMGDRFVLVRVDSTNGRLAAGRKAIGNTGMETQMRAELADAVAGVIAGMKTTSTH